MNKQELKKWKRSILAGGLAVMLLGLCPMYVFAAGLDQTEAADLLQEESDSPWKEGNLPRENDEIPGMSRAEWVHALFQICQDALTGELEDDTASEYFLDLDQCSYADEIQHAFRIGYLPVDLFKEEMGDDNGQEAAGRGAKYFGPEQNLTREFAAVTLVRFLGMDRLDSDPVATEDVGLEFPLEAGISLALGFFQTEDGLFYGNQPVTKDEAQDLLQKAAERWAALEEAEEEGKEEPDSDSETGELQEATERDRSDAENQAAQEDDNEGLTQEDREDDPQADEPDRTAEDMTYEDTEDPLLLEGNLFGNPDMTFAYEIAAETGAIRLLSYTGTESDVVIPAEVTVNGDTRPVEVLGAGLFCDQENTIKSISIRSVAFLPVNGKKVVVYGNSLENCFYGCDKLEKVDLAGLDTSNVESFSAAFAWDSLLADLNLSELDTSKAADMTNMLKGAETLQYADLSTWDVSNLLTTAGMFDGCSGLEEISLHGWHADHLQDADGMFASCLSLREIDLTQAMFPMLEDAAYMFYGCKSLSTIDLSRMDFCALHKADHMFSGCADGEEGLELLKLTDTVMPSLVSAREMFADCSALSRVELAGWDAPMLEQIDGLFYACVSLQNLDLSETLLSRVDSAQYAFAFCSGLEALDLTGMELASVRNIYAMCAGCQSLDRVATGADRGQQWTSLKNAAYAFDGCESLPALNLGSAPSGSLTSIYGMFRDCRMLKMIDISGWNMSAVTDLSCLFQNCQSLTDISFGQIQTGAVTDMHEMFYGCRSMDQIDLSRFDTSNTADMTGMFEGCSSLQILDLSSFDTSFVWETQMEVGGFGSSLEKVIAPKVIGKNFSCIVKGRWNRKKVVIDWAMEPEAEIPVW